MDGSVVRSAGVMKENEIKFRSCKNIPYLSLLFYRSFASGITVLFTMRL